ncbi:MAG: type II CAAX prenyl endopeptidase Rce1 family protein [Bacillota bacterium]
MLTYLVFWVLFVLTGLVIMSNGPKQVQYLMPIICSWAPTFAFIMLFKRLYPNMTFGAYLKQQFSPVLNIPLIITIVAAQVLICFGIAFTYAIRNGMAVSAVLVTSSSALTLRFFDQMARGPLGEELGWRAYALNELQKRHSPLVSSVLLGVVWGLWHTPLWFISGYAGYDLVKYIMFFMVGIIATSIIITAFYNLNKNLMIPIVIHLLFNFLASITQIDTLMNISYITLMYLVFALVLIVINPKKALYGADYSKPSHQIAS